MNKFCKISLCTEQKEKVSASLAAEAGNAVKHVATQQSLPENEKKFSPWAGSERWL